MKIALQELYAHLRDGLTYWYIVDRGIMSRRPIHTAPLSTHRTDNLQKSHHFKGEMAAGFADSVGLIILSIIIAGA